MVKIYDVKKKRISLKFIIILLTLSAIFGLFLYLKLEQLKVLALLSTEGYTKVNVDAGYEDSRGYLSLFTGCKGITMVITHDQAMSIQKALGKIGFFRPLTHDIFKQTLDEYGIKVLMVKIEKFQHGTYYARIFLSKDNKIMSLDARPSDAVAIALRTNSPILVKQSLLQNIC
ncbi:MAG: bifunctional nuclease family protein [Candidatus Aenigmarchaeota archaeon]|nr:bifunctional nuclease family protein [Candidatus Aenigmarchaeota archaeon]